MVSQPPMRPTLTPEERAALLNAEPTLRVVRGVLDDLDEIGFDSAADRDLLNRTEQLRSGLLDKFSTAQPVRNGRGRK